MRVLVTGGTGVVGTSTVTALLQLGHSVRLLSRHAERDARQWSQGVAPVEGDIADPESIRGSGDGCDAVLHLAAIVAESPPETTFERVNVEGTRNVVREAERAGIQRFVYVSSLGAERGSSPYHRSKRAAEEIVRGFRGSWLVLRPGAVYGPGDEHLSVLLKMIRTLPVIPLIGDGNQTFQPAWHEDIGEALAMGVERTDLSGKHLNMAGEEVTTQRELMQMLQEICDRTQVVLPIPEALASLGIKAAEQIGVDVGFNENQMQMLLDGNVLPGDSTNALTEVFGIKPTPLREGLRQLADVQPEQLPSEGVGQLKQKRYWADIMGSRLNADQLFDYVRENFGRLMPQPVEAQAEPGASTRVAEGETLTLSLPLRGHIQVRVAEVTDRRFTLMTLDGHPLAGAVRFQTERLPNDAVRFEIQVYDRAATVVDLVMMRTLGDFMQDGTWTSMVEQVVKASGGSGETHHTSHDLSRSETQAVQHWAEELVMARKRDEAGV
jgi:nucleoside-diphosphate-sugar epimerase